MVTSTMKIPDLDRATAILLALSEHYCLSIKQVMRLYGWKSYPKATIAFKKLVDAGLIYRKRRRGFVDRFGDAYVLLTAGAQQLKEREFIPAFSCQLRQAQEASIVSLTHTLYVNDVLIELYLLQRQHPTRFRIESVEHERLMRKKYGHAFVLYMDGFVRVLVRTKQDWLRMPFFLELEHTSARDKVNWQNKVRRYIDLFDQQLAAYFDTPAAFVLIIVTNPDSVRQLKQWTEEVLTELHKEEYRTWFCIGAFDLTLSPVQFFCTPRFYKPFQTSPQEAFDGLLATASFHE
jgi:hypothetical protein